LIIEGATEKICNLEFYRSQFRTKTLISLNKNVSFQHCRKLETIDNLENYIFYFVLFFVLLIFSELLLKAYFYTNKRGAVPLDKTSFAFDHFFEAFSPIYSLLLQYLPVLRAA
jgi:hypothetical protein